jgi:putative transposase
MVIGVTTGAIAMARPLRIEFPGAFYHVFSRGDQKQKIFFSDDDRFFFLNCLRKACEKFGALVHTYCLMPNHFHLFLETPLGNLARTMHALITSYTVSFNKKHKRYGHLFQGRYRSVLVDTASYAMELSRYIHLNPVRTGLVDRPDRFEWSSLAIYSGAARPERWFVTAMVLGFFGVETAAARRAYLEFVNEGIGKEPPDSIRNSVRTGILGSKEFIERIKRDHLSEEIGKPDRDRPQLRKLRDKPDLPRILSLADKALGPGNRWTVPIAILVSYERTAAKLGEIGEFFSLSVSGVSSAYSRARAAMAENASLARAVKGIEMELFEKG